MYTQILTRLANESSFGAQSVGHEALIGSFAAQTNDQPMAKDSLASAWKTRGGAGGRDFQYFDKEINERMELEKPYSEQQVRFADSFMKLKTFPFMDQLLL